MLASLWFRLFKNSNPYLLFKKIFSFFSTSGIKRKKLVIKNQVCKMLGIKKVPVNRDLKEAFI